MEAIAHDPGFALRAGVPQSVGRGFAEADALRSGIKGTITGKGGFRQTGAGASTRRTVGR